MRNHWRLLLHRCHSTSQSTIARRSPHFQVRSSPNFPSFSSLLGLRAPHRFPSVFDSWPQDPQNCRTRHFCTTSEFVTVDEYLDHTQELINVFSGPRKTKDEIRMKLDSNNIVISHDLVLKVLHNLDSPDLARYFFDYVLDSNGERLSSKAYNLMLGKLGVNGLVKEFWDLVDIMKKKGYGVSWGTRAMVLEQFEKDGLKGDSDKLRQLFLSGSIGDKSIKNLCSRLCKLIRQQVWSDEVEKQLSELNIHYSSDLVAMVLENLGTEPDKALIFFQWVQGSHLLEHDERTYNAMIRVLAREDCIEKFWRVIDEMRGAGYQMEAETYIKALERFVKRKMIKDAVDLYEFAMNGVNKPSVQDCTFLLKKIVVSKELDIDLFLKVVKAFTMAGNVLTDSTLNAVLKSLTSVGRSREFYKILITMVEGGLLHRGTLQRKIGSWLSIDGEKHKTSEFIEEAYGCNPNYRKWSALVEEHCVVGDLDQAADCFQKLVEKEVSSYAGYAFQLLVDAYCSENRAADAGKLLSDLVAEKGFKPWCLTYKVLISQLLVQGCFREALNLLGLMKNQGFPPLLYPFIKYMSKTGTADDAMMFLKVMTAKKLPSTTVFLHIFKAYFKAGRHNEAQDLLSKCPGHIRNHADILNLFVSKRSAKAAAVIAVAS